MSVKKEYQAGDLTIVWQPDLCIHNGNCVKGMPNVFKPKDKPWVQPDGVSVVDLRATIDTCPSGALSYKSAEPAMATDPTPTISAVPVKIIPGGPMIVQSDVTITHADGRIEDKTTKCSFCRCGASQNKPFCDGAHRKIEFDK